MNKPTPVLSARHLSRTYQEGPLKVAVLTDVSLDIQPGERIALPQGATVDVVADQQVLQLEKRW